jgi:hypothetical protein
LPGAGITFISIAIFRLAASGAFSDTPYRCIAVVSTSVAVVVLPPIVLLNTATLSPTVLSAAGPCLTPARAAENVKCAAKRVVARSFFLLSSRKQHLDHVIVHFIRTCQNPGHRVFHCPCLDGHLDDRLRLWHLQGSPLSEVSCQTRDTYRRPNSGYSPRIREPPQTKELGGKKKQPTPFFDNRADGYLFIVSPDLETIEILNRSTRQAVDTWVRCKVGGRTIKRGVERVEEIGKMGIIPKVLFT